MRKVKSLIFLKDASAVGTSERLQALQAQAEVSKAKSVILLKNASAIGASRSEQSKLCIFYKIFEHCRPEGETAKAINAIGSDQSQLSNFV